jgi:hypothetical protein
VALASFAVEWALFGEAPALFHSTNVLLHAGPAVLAACVAAPPYRLEKPLIP